MRKAIPSCLVCKHVIPINTTENCTNMINEETFKQLFRIEVSNFSESWARATRLGSKVDQCSDLAAVAVAPPYHFSPPLSCNVGAALSCPAPDCGQILPPPTCCWLYRLYTVALHSLHLAHKPYAEECSFREFLFLLHALNFSFL